MLVHALPVLKRWIREDKYKLVVPLSGQSRDSQEHAPPSSAEKADEGSRYTALSTLDVLKKAPQPLHGLAREATRFLEGQLAIAHQIQSAFSPENAEGRIRLRAQTAKEETSWAEVQQLFTVPQDWVVELPEGVEPPLDEDGETPLSLPSPTADDIPRHLRGSLQCALHFARPAATGASTADPAAPVPTVLFRSSVPPSPPLAADVAKLVRKANDSAHSSPPRKPSTAGPPSDFLAISSGDALAYYLDTFFPSASSTTYEEVSPSQVEAASAWFKQQAANRQSPSSSASARETANRQSPSASSARQPRTKPDSGRQTGGQGRGKGARRSSERDGSTPLSPGGRTLFSPT